MEETPKPVRWAPDKCPRCGKPHAELELVPLVNGRLHGDHNYYTVCPTTQEPILVMRAG